MPHTKPFTITSPRHSMAGATYAVCAAVGLLHLTDVANSPSMAAVITEQGVNLWAMLLVLSGIGGLIVTNTVSLARVPVRPLRGERLTALGLAVCILGYEAVLFCAIGLDAMTTQAIATGLGVGAAARAIQITRELRRLAKALQAPVQLTAPVLAEPQHNGDTHDHHTD